MDLKILEIASDNKNQKIIKNHTHCSKLKNSICGDEIQIKLMIKQNKIIDFGYQGESCIYCQATASLLSKILINSDKTKIKKLCADADSYFQGNLQIIKKRWTLLDKLFKQKNLARKECILLPFKTLKKIISN